METPAQDASAIPHLTQLAAFQDALAHYHMSDETKRILSQTALVLLTGPTSSGRNTIINELVATGDYHYIISDTTRPPRVNDGVLEQDGVQYWFRNEADFLREVQQGEFLEAEVIHGQQVSGVSIRELKKALDEHRIAITDVDIGGIEHVLAAKPDTVPIIVLPPSFEEWRRRLLGRGEMDSAQLKRRLATACRIYEETLTHPDFKLVVNDTLKHTAVKINALAHGEPLDSADQTAGKELTRTLLAQTKAWHDEL